MAKKDLARAALEAGNQQEYQNVRRTLRRRHRHEAKAYCRLVARDPERAEAMVEPIAPEHRQPDACWASDMHGDKTGGVSRWLATFVGKRWDDVYSEVRRRFDVRTLAGWHVVTQHIIGMFAREGSHQAAYREYIIGYDGIVRRNDERFRWRSTATPRATVTESELFEWLAGRKIAECGPRSFWIVPTSASRTYVEQHRRSDWLRKQDVVDEYRVHVSRYRQDRPLNREERAFFERLTPMQQAAVTNRDPTRTFVRTVLPVVA
ncbi:hypothetical protein HY480_00620 [Candidatus Uhrbacteria bacterium]|nr:hypothetical protein [Candidatus Uhrbacteria bacterium]